MRKLTILSIIFLYSLHFYSQKDTILTKFKKEIDCNYNWSHIGRNLSINYNQYIGRHAIIIGVKQHYNSVITDDHSYYKNKGHANNVRESIGLNIGYKFDLLRKHEYLMPYVFFQSQISKIRFKRNYEYSEYRNNTIVVNISSEISEPLFVTENYIGFGLKVKLYKTLFLNQTIGAGIATFETSEKYYHNGKLRNYNLEGCSSIKIGLIYQLK